MERKTILVNWKCEACGAEQTGVPVDPGSPALQQVVERHRALLPAGDEPCVCANPGSVLYHLEMEGDRWVVRLLPNTDLVSGDHERDLGGHGK